MAELITPDTVNQPEAVTQTPAPKYDWVLSALQNQIPKSQEEFANLGVSMSEFGIKPIDKYWENDFVKNAYDGNKNAFEQDYVTLQKNYLKGQYNEFYTNNFIKGQSAMERRAAELGRPNLRRPQAIKMNLDPWGRSFDTYSGYGPKQYGIREKALERVKIGDSYIPFDTYGSDKMLKFAKDENGQYAVDPDDGQPYMVPVQEGEELKSYDEVYNKFSDFIGGYGFDYSLGTFLGSLPKNAVNFFSESIDSVIEFPKTLMQGWGDTDSDLYKGLINAENWAKSIHVATTERGQESMFSAESLADLSQQVIWQLMGMVATGGSVSGVAKLLGASDKGIQTAASIGSKLFMTGIAAGPIADVAREAGLSSRETALMLGLYSSILYPIMGLSEAVIGRLNLNSSTAAIADMAGKVGIDVLPKSSANLTKELAVKAAKNPKLWRGFKYVAGFDLKSKLWRAETLSKNNMLAALGAGAALESVEETTEQLADLGVRNLYNYYNEVVPEDSWIAKSIDTNKEVDFNFDWLQEFNALGFSAVGGAIGGGIAAPFLRHVLKVKPHLAKSVMDTAVDGKENAYYRRIKKLYDEGRLAPKFLDGKESELIGPEEGKMDANQASYNILKGMMDHAVRMRDEVGLDKLYKNNYDKQADLKRYFDQTISEDPKEAGGIPYINFAENLKTDYLRASSMGVVAGELHRDIFKLTEDIKELKASENADPEHIKELQEEKDIKVKRLSEIINGKATEEFVIDGMYGLFAVKNPLNKMDISKLNGYNYVNLNKAHLTFNQRREENYVATLDRQKEIDDAADIINPETLENITPDKKQQLREESLSEVDSTIQKVLKKFEGNTLIEQEIGNLYGGEEGFETDDQVIKATDAFINFIDSSDDVSEEIAADESIIELLSNLQKYKNVLQAKTTVLPTAPSEQTSLLTMVGPAGEKMLQPLNTLIEDSLVAEERMFDSSPQTYVAPTTGTGDNISNRLLDIKDSIIIRRSQIIGNYRIAETANKMLDSSGREDNFRIPIIPKEQAVAYVSLLDEFETRVDKLIEASNQNRSNTSAAIKKHTLAILNRNFETLGRANLYFTDETLLPLGTLIREYIPRLDIALNQNEDPDEYLAIQREMEAEVFNQFSGRKKDIYNAINEHHIKIISKDYDLNTGYNLQNPTGRGKQLVDAIEDGDYDHLVEEYNYIRGILALSSNDFWNAYYSFFSENINENVESYEQLLVIKETVHSLMADEYGLDWMKDSNDAVVFHNSVFIPGGGGAGKSTKVAPISAEIARRLIGGGKVLIHSHDVKKSKKKIESLKLFEDATKTQDAEGNSIQMTPVSDLKLSQLIESDLDVFDDVSVIVIDEATLLREREKKKNPPKEKTTTAEKKADKEKKIKDKEYGIRDYQEKINKINKIRSQIRKVNKKSLPVIKVIYTGDLKQNSIDTEAQAIFDNVFKHREPAKGFDNVTRNLIAKSSELQYSFRQVNSELKQLSEKLARSQREFGLPSESMVSTYSTEDGAEIINSRSSFDSAVRKTINRYRENDMAHELVYITDRTDLDFGGDVEVLTPVESQGKEWEHAIVDIRDGRWFTPDQWNTITKREAYTAVTRAKRKVTAFLQPDQGISSKRGKVYTYTPIKFSEEREKRFESLDKILGDNKTGKYNEARTGAVEEVTPETAKEILQKKEALKRVEAKLIIEEEETGEVQVNIPKLIEQLSRKDTVNVMTHPVPPGSKEDIEDHIDRKRRALYPAEGEEFDYFVSIARFGSGAYNNVIKHKGFTQQERDDKAPWVMWVEAIVDGKQTIIGTLPQTFYDENGNKQFELNDLINSLDIDPKKKSISIQVDKSVLMTPEYRGPHVVYYPKAQPSDSVQTFLESLPQGITVGSPRIITTSPLINVHFGENAQPGDLSYPISLKYTSAEEIDAAVDNVADPRHMPDGIAWVNMRRGVFSLDKSTGDKGLFASTGALALELIKDTYNENYKGIDTDSGLYHSIWGHLSTRPAAGTETASVGYNFLTKLFRDLAIEERKDGGDPRLAELFDYYSQATVKAKSEEEAKSKSLTKFQAQVERKNSEVRAYYFMADYIDFTEFDRRNNLPHDAPKVKKNADAELFERAFLKVGSAIGDFDIAIRISKDGSESTVPHIKTAEYPEGFIEQYMLSRAKVTFPWISIKKTEVIKSLEKGLTNDNPTTPVVERVKPVDGSILDNQKTGNTDDNNGFTRGQLDSLDGNTNPPTGEAYAGPSKDHETFINKWFPGSNYIMADEFVKYFKRNIFNSLYDFSGDGQIFDINVAMQGMIDANAEFLAQSPDRRNLENWQDQLPDNKDEYFRYVSAVEFEYLLKKYFPAIVATESGFAIQTTHKSSTFAMEFGDFDASSLYNEEFTEMIRMQIENTPLISRESKQSKNPGNLSYVKNSAGQQLYMNSSHLEEVMEELRGVKGEAEAIEKLANSYNTAAVSFYNRFIRPDQHSIGSGTKAGQAFHSFISMNKAEGKHIATSLLQAILSTDSYILASIVFDQGKQSYRGLPLSASGRPNIIRDSVYSSFESTIKGLDIKSFDRGKKFGIGGVMISRPDLTDTFTGTEIREEADSIIKVIKSLGAHHFTYEMMEHLYNSSSVPGSINDPQRRRQVHRFLTDTVVFPLINALQIAIKDKKAPKLNKIRNELEAYIFTPIIEVNEINPITRQKNINNENVERLRRGAPALRVKERIQEIRNTSDSVLEMNLLAAEDSPFEIIAPIIKEGIRQRIGILNRNKPMTSMSVDELFEQDVIFGFQDRLKSDSDVFVIPISVFGDSKSNLNLVIKIKDLGIPNATLRRKIFDYRSDYYTKLNRKIKNAWAKAQVTEGITKTSEVKNKEGFVSGIHYDPNSDVLRMSPDLKREIDFYSNKRDNLIEFGKELDRNYALLRNFAETEVDGQGRTLFSKLGVESKNMTADQVLRQFYNVWLAVSTSWKDMMVGPRNQYDSKGKEAVEAKERQFIDEVKRTSSILTPRNKSVFRNEDWTPSEDPYAMTENEFLEGSKLKSKTRVAFVSNEIAKIFDLAQNKYPEKDPLDGATFTSRIHQLLTQASYGKYGPMVPTISKDINSSFDPELGVLTVVKHASFMITEEMLINSPGNPTIITEDGKEEVNPFYVPIQLFRQMHGRKFDSGKTYVSYEQDGQIRFREALPNEKNTISTPLGILEAYGVDTTTFDVIPDAELETDSPRIPSREESLRYYMDRLFDFLVRFGEQETVITEVITTSTAKTGVKSINDINQRNDFSTEMLDITGRGQVLNAWKPSDTQQQIRTLTQMINAAGLNWAVPQENNNLLQTIRTYTETILDIVKEKRQTEEFESMLREWVRNGLMQSESLTYQFLLAARNPDFSLEDPQVFNSVFTTLANVLSRGQQSIMSGNKGGGLSQETNDQFAAIVPSYRGGHYILHPSMYFMPVYEVERNGIRVPTIGMSLTEEEKARLRNGDLDLQPRQLAYEEPYKIIDGVKIGFEDFIKMAQSEEEVQAVYDSLGDGTWESGYAEIVLPADFKDEFLLDEALYTGLTVQEMDETYFFGQLVQKHPDTKKEQLLAKANLMAASFHMKMNGLATRIPATGKHSAINTRIVGFMNGSGNALFMNPKVLYLQGADQDIDKGEYITYETIDGIVPLVDSAGNKLSDEEMVDFFTAAGYLKSDGTPLTVEDIKGAKVRESHKKIKRYGIEYPEYKLAGLKNRAVDSFIKIVGAPQNAVELNTSVETIMDEMKILAEKRLYGDEGDEAVRALKQKLGTFDRDNILSMWKSYTDNQAGKALVGIFANAYKVYQIAKVGQKYADGDEANPDIIKDEVWVQFAALINAATDNAKEQILGPLGINQHNANMVSAMVMEGMSIEEIVKFLDKNREPLEKYYTSMRYDSTQYGRNKFNPRQEFNDELAEWFYKGQEINVVSSNIFNRGIPHTPYDMWNTVNSLESFINENLNVISFDYMTFINNDTYAKEVISAYDTAVAQNSILGLNIPAILYNAPHVRGYSRVFATMYETLEEMFPIFVTANQIATDYAVNGFVNEDVYKNILNFVYGKSIADYFYHNSSEQGDATAKSYKYNLSGYNLAPPSGRTRFVQYMNTDWYNSLKDRYPDNLFANSLHVVDEIGPGRDSKGNRLESKRIRLIDTNAMNENHLLMVKKSFAELDSVDQRKIAHYALITEKGRQRQGGLSMALDPEFPLLLSYNQFLRSRQRIDIDNTEYTNYYRGKYIEDSSKGGLLHNAIPYSGPMYLNEDIPEGEYISVTDQQLAEEDEAFAKEIGGKFAFKLYTIKEIAKLNTQFGKLFSIKKDRIFAFDKVNLTYKEGGKWDKIFEGKKELPLFITISILSQPSVAKEMKFTDEQIKALIPFKQDIDDTFRGNSEKWEESFKKCGIPLIEISPKAGSSTLPSGSTFTVNYKPKPDNK